MEISFLFPEVVHGLLPSRFSSENLTSVLRNNSADSSLSWKQDGGEVHWNLSPQKSCTAEIFSPGWHGPRSNGQPIPCSIYPAGCVQWEIFVPNCVISPCQRDTPIPWLDRQKQSHWYPKDKLCSTVSAHHHCWAQWEKYSHSVWETA